MNYEEQQHYKLESVQTIAENAKKWCSRASRAVCILFLPLFSHHVALCNGSNVYGLVANSTEL